MRHHRSGSAILLCLALAAIAVMIGFAFLRVVSRQEISGTSEMLDGLARDAARSGLAHATEQIMADFNAASLDVAVGSSSSSTPVKTTIGPVPTHLDGPYRAPFATLVKPGLLLYTQSAATGGTDDVQQENHLLMPFIKKDSDGAQARVAEAWFVDHGLMIYEGRGRYYEPGYYDTGRPDPTVANPLPVNTVRFTDLNAAPTDPAATRRSSPVFLDRDLHRLTSGTGTIERSTARYRIRYAVGVEDMQGHLLANPRADMNIDWTKANNDYRVIPPWLNTATYVWNNMNQTLFGSYPTVPLRMDHIFRGRGNASNADRAWAAGTTKGQPAAFPWMFRAGGWKTNPLSGGFYPGVVGWEQWWGSHTWDGVKADASLYDGVYDGGSIPPNTENMGGRLYRNPEIPPINPDPAGGQILYPRSYMGPHPYVHALLGPQVSWYNQLASVQGYLPAFGRYGESQDGYISTSNNIDVINSSQSYYLTSFSVFGRRMEQSSTAPAARKWYEGPVDSPWLVNALTATPQTVNQMLLAYLPPYLKTLKWTHETYYKKIGENITTDAGGNKSVSDIFDTVSYKTVNGPWFSSVRGIDILNDQLGSGFADFPAPASVDAGFTIKPDYYQDDPEPRPIVQRYPGPLSRGDSTAIDQGSDDLGQYIDADSRGIGRCTHTGKPLIFLGGSDQWRTEDKGGLEPGYPWNTKDGILRHIDTLTYKYRYSYFWDLTYALTQALAVARSTWVQYPNSFFTPSSGFAPVSLRDPTAYDTLAKLDRLFLRQLGENYDNPGTPCPDNPITQTISAQGNSWDVFAISFALSPTPAANSIKSALSADLLKTSAGVSSAERAKVMERMLNDFRLSFLGASPAYSDSFRPLDFDGDGKVHCSCYDINTLGASPEEIKYKTARWKDDDGVGHGPAPSALSRVGIDYTTGFSNNPWFCATGAFFIGKSHYYRVFVRGEVYDNLLNKPITTRTLESVLAVDPEATIDPHAGSRPSANKLYTQTLFQRWHYNDQTSELPRHVR